MKLNQPASDNSSPRKLRCWLRADRSPDRRARRIADADIAFRRRCHWSANRENIFCSLMIAPARCRPDRIRFFLPAALFLPPIGMDRKCNRRDAETPRQTQRKIFLLLAAFVLGVLCVSAVAFSFPKSPKLDFQIDRYDRRFERIGPQRIELVNQRIDLRNK